PVHTAFAQDLEVTVRDAHSNPIPSAHVTWTAPGSGASATFASGGAVDTDAAGVAHLTATAHAVSGGYTVTPPVARVAPSAQFSLTNDPGAAASIALVGGDSQSAEVTTPFGAVLEVVVRDADGNPVPDAHVTFAAPGSGASATFDHNPATTDAAGHASVT